MTVPSTLQPGDEVYVLSETYDGCRFGKVDEHRPQNAGYLVRPADIPADANHPGFGWGYGELGLIPKPGQRWVHVDDPNWMCEIFSVRRDTERLTASVGDRYSLAQFLRFWNPAPRTRWERLMA